MEPMPISAVLRHQAVRRGDDVALVCGGQTLSWAALDRRSNRLAHAYCAAGVRQNDFVTIALANGIAFFEVCFAIWKLGAIPNPVSFKAADAELSAWIDLIRPKLVVTTRPASFPGWKTASPDADAFDAFPDTSPADAVSRHWKAIASGGSTGRPKIIVSHAEGMFDPETPQFEQRCGGTVLCAGPLHHNAPFLMSSSALFCGNRVVIMPRFDAEETLRLIAHHRVDWVCLVPTMMHRIWRLGENIRNRYDLSSLRTVLHLAAPCAGWLKRAWIGWLGAERIFELYGLTEGIGRTWITGPEWLSHPGSVGRPLDGAQFRIFTASGNHCVSREIGDLYFRPASGVGSTYHYLGDSATRRGEWEATGDLGYADECGFLYLADRRTDLIISGGANIYAAEVEAALEAHSAVRAAVAIGLPDEEYGARVHAIVEVAAPAGAPLEQELQKFLDTHLSRYKQPRSYEFVTEPLRNDAGKVQRKALRDARIAAPLKTIGDAAK